jgi:hypothetical protein
MKESVERNKKLVATEENKIDSIIKSNPDKKFIDVLVSEDINRSTTSKLTRRHSFKRPNQKW